MTPKPMIELDEFSISRDEYFRLVFRPRLKIYYWICACFAVVFLAMTIAFDDWKFPVVGFLTGVVAGLITVYIKCRYYLPPANYHQKRKLSFDADKFHAQIEDGSESHILLHHIIRADRFGGYYRLFLNRINYYPIPISAFRSEEDRRRFEAEILGDKLKTKTVPWKAILIFVLLSACLLGLAYTFSGKQIQKSKIDLHNHTPMKELTRSNDDNLQRSRKGTDT